MHVHVELAFRAAGIPRSRAKDEQITPQEVLGLRELGTLELHTDFRMRGSHTPRDGL